MARRKGQLLLGGVVLAAIGIGGFLFFRQAGQLFAGIPQFFRFLFNNSGNILLLLLPVTLAIIVVRNAASKNPQWRNDFKWAAAGFVAVSVFVLAVPAVSGVVGGYTTDVEVTVVNEEFAPPKIGSVSVSEFKSSGPFAAALSQTFSFADLFPGWPYDNIQGRLEVVCDGNQVTLQPFSLNVNEDSSESKTVTVSGIPPSSTCKAIIHIKSDEGGEDTKSIRFTTPAIF